MIDIIESGDVPDTDVAYDANGVPYAKDYFQEGYKEMKIVDLDDNPDNVTKLAELLGIKESELKASQDAYRKKYFIK
jgi:phosphoribosylformimino-5-aminoimidazole carboxamide ribonucleotide (ProFAR) isomerase